MKTHAPLLAFAMITLSIGAGRADEPEIVFADFEGEDYGAWTTTGTAFGPGPAAGTLPDQMPVSGFQGKRLVNSYFHGDASTGTLTSPEFKIERKYITFLIGGGGHAGKTCMNLMVDGRVARTATGPAAGSEMLEPASWEVSDLAGKKARLAIVDDATGGWGHVNVDQIVFTNAKPAADMLNVARELKGERRFLHFPVTNGGKPRKVTVAVEGRAERQFDLELADAEADWWAALDISAWKGKPINVEVDRLPEGSKSLESLAQSDALKNADDLYREALRPQFHFSARRGWLNDPNGLAYLDGEYHLFFQHNPYGWNWGNMHWGHAVSRDLVHWQELGESLYPDRFGPMFSGSAVVDHTNTSGFGRDGVPPLVAIYTAAGDPTVQCIAYSTDRGRTFTKYDGNPVIQQITPGNRDPKVLWHEPTKHWVLVLYVHRGDAETLQFFTSPNLKEWTAQGTLESFFECPDLFELPLDGETRNKKWVVTAASSEYMVGAFDGKKFTPETPKLPGHRGRGFYAAQTYSDIPAGDGRRIQIGWFQAPTPGMAFNNSMTVPLNLTLRGAPDGPRLAWQPVKELESLRAKSHKFEAMTLSPGDNPLAKLSVELADVRLDFEPGDAKEIAVNVRGIPVVYDTAKQEIIVNGLHAPAPLQNGRQRLAILVDRSALEVFASDGLTYVPMPVIPDARQKGLELSAKGGSAQIKSLEVHELNSAWAEKK